MRWLALTLLTVPVVVQAEEPFRLHERVGLPWLRFGLEHRSRVEHLQSDYRQERPANATAYSMRTLLLAEVQAFSLVAGAELEDARTRVTPPALLDTTFTNPLELLQAYVGLRFTNLVVDAFAAWRLVWLASAQDGWANAGLRAAPGSLDRFVGQLAEARVRWHVFRNNLLLDLGGKVTRSGAMTGYLSTQLTGTL